MCVFEDSNIWQDMTGKERAQSLENVAGVSPFATCINYFSQRDALKNQISLSV